MKAQPLVDELVEDGPPHGLVGRGGLGRRRHQAEPERALDVGVENRIVVDDRQNAVDAVEAAAVAGGALRRPRLLAGPGSGRGGEQRDSEGGGLHRGVMLA